MSFYSVAKVIVTPVFRLLYGMRTVNASGFPMDETVIVASNHTSLIDPVLLGVTLKKPLYFMAKAELFKFKPFGALIRKLGAFPVKRGRRDNDATERAEELIAQGKTFALFPQGTRMPGREEPDDARPGVALFASHSGAGVLPVYIYNRKGKVRIFSRNVIVVGDVVPASEFGGEKATIADMRASASALMARMFALKEKVPEKWR